MGKKPPEGMPKRRHWLVVIKSRILVGKKPPEGMPKRRHWLVVKGARGNRTWHLGVVRSMALPTRPQRSWIMSLIHKKSIFGGEKKPEGMPKRRHWLG